MKLKFGGIIFLLVGFLMITGGVFEWRQHQLMNAKGIDTEGEIIGYESEQRYDNDSEQYYTVHMAIVEYTDKNGFTLQDKSLSRDPKKFPEHSKVPLRYLPEDSKNIEYTDSPMNAVLPYLLGAIGSLFFSVGVFILRVRA